MMNKKFNLLLLHQPEDIHPRTWICLNGKRLGPIFMRQVASVLRYRHWSRSKLNKTFAKKLSCAESTMEWIFSGKRKTYPIPLVVKLSELTKDGKRFLRTLENKTEYLKVNSASSKPVRIVNRLNKNLAKILGAFMADGSLSTQVIFAASHPQELTKIEQELTALGIKHSKRKVPSRNQHCINVQANHDNIKSLSRLMRRRENLIQTHYTIELTDEYKDSVTAFARWIRQEFEISPNRFERKKGAWRVGFSNKILARYLMAFFDVLPGTKTYDAFEPRIIQISSLKIRKAFAKGVLMFDGCVGINKELTLTSKSKILIRSIVTIWAKDNIKFGTTQNERGGGYSSSKTKNYTCFTTTDNEKRSLLKYLEPKTQKWKLLKWLSGDSDVIPVIKTKNGLSLKSFLKLLRKIGICDAIFLKEYFGCSHSTIRAYLKILRDQKKIHLSNRPKQINDYVSGNSTILLKKKLHQLVFKKIRRQFKHDKNFAKFLGIHKATISAWRKRKIRIPLNVLEKMCKVLDISLEKATKNVAKIDREIAEIIQ